MKKKIIITSLIVFFIAAVVLTFLFGKMLLVSNNEKEAAKTDILSFNERTEVEEYLLNKDTEYILRDDYCYILSEEVLNSTAEIDISFDGDIIQSLHAYFALFTAEYDVDESDEDAGSDMPAYTFSDADKTEIQESFDKVKGAFEEFVGCEIDTYDLLPTTDLGETISIDDEQAFYEGLVIREYSVRDASGILWILRYDAFDGMASAVLMKIVDETGYEGFIPIVDMTK